MRVKTRKFLSRTGRDAPSYFGADNNYRLHGKTKSHRSTGVKKSSRKSLKRYAVNLKPYNAGGLGHGGWSMF